MKTPEHPAKFSPAILDAITDILLDEMDENGWAPTVLDPFAGVGTIEQAWPLVVGVELEPEWAVQGQKVIVGSALRLPFSSESFDAVATSPCYGNRMADHHNAKEKCRPCSGTGKVPATPGHRDDGEFDRCEKCDGKGRREYDRITYKHKLGRPLSEDSSAVMQWGPAYRKFHRKAWREASRVLKPEGLLILNIGDHIRGHKRQRVTAWHDKTLRKLGFERERRIKIQMKKMKKGANRDARIHHEWVIAYRKVS